MQAPADVELSWMEKIHQEGRQEGMHAILISMVSHKFGTPPEAFIQHLQAISDPELLIQISSQILEADTLSEAVLLASTESAISTGE